MKLSLYLTYFILHFFVVLCTIITWILAWPFMLVTNWLEPKEARYKFYIDIIKHLNNGSK